MSPSSVCYKVELNGDLALPSHMPSGVKPATTSFQFGIRSKLHHHAEKVSVSALKVCKDSHRIRKPPLPLPRPTVRPSSSSSCGQQQLRSPVQYRAPIIIHTYSPEVIHTQPDDFMSLVQKLTGSCDTRHRLKRKKAFGSKKSSPRVLISDRSVTATAAVTAAVAALEQQQQQQQQAGLPAGSGGLNCGSPSSSEDDSATVVPRDGLASAKQSNSPRGPLSNFEFDTSTPNSSDNDTLKSDNDTSKSYNDPLKNVKAEPVDSGGGGGFNFCTGLKPLPLPETSFKFHFGGDLNSPLPSPGGWSPGGFLSPGLFAGLPELSPGTAAWSQQFLDCLNASPQPPLPDQPPLQRQRALNSFAAVPEGTMVALENIQAFMLT